MRQQVSLARLVNKPQETLISDENAAQAKLHRTLDVVECVHKLIHSHMSPTNEFAIRGQGLCRTFPGSTRAHEETDFDAVSLPELNHIANVSIAQ